MTDHDLRPLQIALSKNAHKGRPYLLPALLATQELYGYIPQNAAAEIARVLCVPLADVYGVIDFYALLHKEPVNKTILHICNDPVCAMAGSGALLKEFSSFRNKQDYTIERAPCLGLCEHAPAVMIKDVQRGDVDVDARRGPLDEIGQKPYGIIGGEKSHNHGELRHTAGYHPRGICVFRWIHCFNESSLHAACGDRERS